ncbi:hypothetical protein PtrSN002B_012212, partial [Pyrenophora tritici-repentis]
MLRQEPREPSWGIHGKHPVFCIRITTQLPFITVSSYVDGLVEHDHLHTASAWSSKLILSASMSIYIPP